MTDERRQILELVAAGELSPEHAAEQLAELDGPTEPTEGRRVTMSKRVLLSDPEPESSRHDDIQGVKIIGRFRALRIQGDQSVAGAIVEGPHKARTEDGLMVIEDADPDPDEPGYVLFGGPQTFSRRKGINIEAKINGREFRIGDGAQPPALKVRMNPDLPLDVEITAGSVRVNGVTAGIRANITAGSGRFEGVRSPVDLAVEAGSINVQGVFDSGESDIRCSAGKIRVELERGSNVRVKARATLGKVHMPGPEDPRDRKRQGVGAEQEFVVGEGKARLDIEATTGTVSVETSE